jgi:hypothetical protein
MERISDRHEGDLGGRLGPFVEARPAVVAVVVPRRAAELAATQHTAWMLVNLLARAVGIVATVHIVCPPGIRFTGRVVPLAGRGLPLGDALVAGGQAVGAVPVQRVAAPQECDITLIVGGGHDEPPTTWSDVRHVVGDGWWGSVAGEAPPLTSSGSDLPFGPYVAACLAAAEIFLRARLPEPFTYPIGTVGWDCWGQALARRPAPGAPPALSDLDLSGTGLAGAGAVGTAWMHALWATTGVRGDVIVTDVDKKGVTTTSLNRCPLFGMASLDAAKAPEAARIAADATITWRPHHGRFEDLRITPALLVSAVDTNRARAALQDRYPPLVLSGSSRDLRAEVLRVGPPGSGACLRCYNPPEPLVADDDLRARARDGGELAVSALAAQAGVNEAAARRWLDRPACGQVGDRLLAALQRDTAEPAPRFAVGFTSVMAGTLLAAETVKLLVGRAICDAPPNANNVTFQFLRPTAAANAAAPLARDPRCPACAPATAATRIWQRRFDQARRPA